MRGALPLVLALSALGCQSHPEKGVVDQYFNAVNTKDTQTLSSFAALFRQESRSLASMTTREQTGAAAALAQR